MTKLHSVDTASDPVALSSAIATLLACRETMVVSLPEAGNISLTFEPTGRIKAEIVVGGAPSETIQSQTRILFRIENDMIPGVRLTHAAVRSEVRGRRVVTAMLEG